MDLAGTARGDDAIPDHLGHRIGSGTDGLRIGVGKRRVVRVLPDRLPAGRFEREDHVLRSASVGGEQYSLVLGDGGIAVAEGSAPQPRRPSLGPRIGQSGRGRYEIAPGSAPEGPALRRPLGRYGLL